MYMCCAHKIRVQFYLAEMLCPGSTRHRYLRSTEASYRRKTVRPVPNRGIHLGTSRPFPPLCTRNQPELTPRGIAVWIGCNLFIPSHIETLGQGDWIRNAPF